MIFFHLEVVVGGGLHGVLEALHLASAGAEELLNPDKDGHDGHQAHKEKRKDDADEREHPHGVGEDEEALLQRGRQLQAKSTDPVMKNLVILGGGTDRPRGKSI
eukprot:263392-Prorocentrum_minimum.AAC.1